MGRSAIVFATTMFKAVCYSQDESQIITAGTDRKVSHAILSDSTNLFMQKRTVYLQIRILRKRDAKNTHELR